MKKILFVFVTLIIFGCSSVENKNLPKIKLPWNIESYYKLKRDSFSPDIKGNWEYHKELSLKLMEISNGFKYEAINGLFDMSLENSSFISTIATIDFKYSSIERGYRENIFLNKKLSQEKLLLINGLWKNLLRAEYYLLYSALITAELKNKALEFKKSSPQKKYKILAQVQALPVILEIDNILTEVKLLKKVCKQLIYLNADFEIPSWEEVYNEDIKENKIKIEKNNE